MTGAMSGLKKPPLARALLRPLIASHFGIKGPDFLRSSIDLPINISVYSFIARKTRRVNARKDLIGPERNEKCDFGPTLRTPLLVSRGEFFVEVPQSAGEVASNIQ